MAFDAGAIVGKAYLDTKAWTRGMKVMQSSGQMLGKGFATLGRMGTVAFAAIATGVTAAIKTADKFEKEFANVSTLVDTSVVSVEGMKEELLGLDARLGSSTDLTKGLYQALSASVEPAKAVEFVGEAAKFAKAALIDTKTSVDVLTTAINAYGPANMEAARASDVLFQTIKLGKTTGEELAGSLGDVIPIASTMGLNFENLGASMATMTKQGIATSKATTSLRGIMTSFMKPTVELKQAFLDAGFATGAAVTKADNFQEALRKVILQTDGSQEAIAALFPNVRALNGVLALTGQGAQSFTDDLNAMGNAAGSTDEAFAKQRLTFDTLKVRMEKFAITIGQNLLPVADKFASGLGEMLEGLTANEEFMTALVDIGEAFGKVLESLAPILVKIIPFIAEFAKMFAEVVSVGAEVVGWLTDGFIPATVISAQALEDQKEAVREQKKAFMESNPLMREAISLTNELGAATMDQVNVAIQSLRVQRDQVLRSEGQTYRYELLSKAVGKLEVKQKELMETSRGTAESFEALSLSAGDLEGNLNNGKDAIVTVEEAFMRSGFRMMEAEENKFAALKTYYEEFSIKGQSELARLRQTAEAEAAATAEAYKEMGTTISGYLGPILNEMGTMLIDQEKGWADVGIAAIKAIASVVRALGEQFAIQSAAAFIPGPTFNPVAGAGYAAVSAAAFIAAGVIDALAGGLKKKKSGGITTPGMTLVGEEGPEIYDFGRTGTIIPAGDTRDMMGGGQIINVTFTGPVNSEVDVEQAMMIAGRRLQNKARRIK
jgi:TP901 family phage tail tape measure protein